MSTAEHSRWYILPAIVVDNEGLEEQVPKYVTEDDRLYAYSGTVISRDTLGKFAGLAQRVPDQEDWYLCRVYGRGDDGLQALDTLSESYQDTASVATDRAFLAQALNQRLDQDRSAEGWERSFRIGPA